MYVFLHARTSTRTQHDEAHTAQRTDRAHARRPRNQLRGSEACRRDGGVQAVSLSHLLPRSFSLTLVLPLSRSLAHSLAFSLSLPFTLSLPLSLSPTHSLTLTRCRRSCPALSAAVAAAFSPPTGRPHARGTAAGALKSPTPNRSRARSLGSLAPPPPPVSAGPFAVAIHVGRSRVFLFVRPSVRFSARTGNEFDPVPEWPASWRRVFPGYVRRGGSRRPPDPGACRRARRAPPAHYAHGPHHGCHRRGVVLERSVGRQLLVSEPLPLPSSSRARPRPTCRFTGPTSDFSSDPMWTHSPPHKVRYGSLARSVRQSSRTRTQTVCRYRDQENLSST